MEKIKVTADTLLEVLKSLMHDEDINYTITDTSAPSEWQGKTVQQALGVEYYTFRHKPIDTEVIIQKLLEESESPNALLSLSRAFCLLSMDTSERVFSKDRDTVTVVSSLEYWVQTEKVKLLENMFEDLSIATNGIRIPIQIGNQSRKIMVVFGAFNVTEIEEATEFGQMAICEIEMDVVFYQNIVSRCDYTVEFYMEPLTSETDTSDETDDTSDTEEEGDSSSTENADGDSTEENTDNINNEEDESNTSEEDDEDESDLPGTWVSIPFSGLNISTTMTQKSVPLMNMPRNIGNINLSRVKTITLTFDGYVNAFIEELCENSLASDIDKNGASITSDVDNNSSVIMRLTRGDTSYYYDCIIKDHSITVQEDTGNETHSLTLTTRGYRNGTT